MINSTVSYAFCPRLLVGVLKCDCLEKTMKTETTMMMMMMMVAMKFKQIAIKLLFAYRER